jgi:hypothetical protein
MLYLVLHRHTVGFTLLLTTLAAAVILYFTWYKHLPPPAPDPMEEAETLDGEAVRGAERAVAGGAR